MSFPLSSIILAAGEGRRMGLPKALLHIDGQSVLQHVVRTHQAAGISECTVVVGARGAEAEALIVNCGARIIHHVEWARGQTSSLQCGLRASRLGSAGFLIAPVDHPGARAGEISALAQAFFSPPFSSEAIVRPRCLRMGGHPVLFGAMYRDRFLALKDDQPGHSVYRASLDKVRWVEVDNPRIGLDLDTLADLDRWRAEGEALMPYPSPAP